MTDAPDWKGIAGRIQGLIGMSDRGQIATAAARLGVRDQELRDALEGSPSPALKVVAAIVRLYGLDPTWVLTGHYDAVTHRATMAHDEAAIQRALTALTGEHPSSPDDQSVEQR